MNVLESFIFMYMTWLFYEIAFRYKNQRPNSENVFPSRFAALPGKGNVIRREIK